MQLIYLLLFFIPKANPDFEPLYPSIRRWYVEVDDEGNAVREVGLNEDGASITLGPWEGNYGFWTDSTGPFPADPTLEISQAEFEGAWASVGESNNGA